MMLEILLLHDARFGYGVSDIRLHKVALPAAQGFESCT